jgi:hypothetical protein
MWRLTHLGIETAEDRAEDYAAVILDWIRGGYRAA